MPLDAAIASAGIRLPDDALLAIRSNARNGARSLLAKSTSQSSVAVDSARNAAVGRLEYLSVLALFAAGLIVFLVLHIMPAFQKIFSDFKTNLPTVTLAVLKSYVSVNSLAIFCLVLLFAVLLFALARYAGQVRWDPPLVRLLASPLDEALVLRSLAQSIEQGSTMTSALAWLAKRYPKQHICDRLRNAVRHMDNGVHWCDSLQASNLLPAAEAGVLKAAERVGNLVWALNDTADRLSRRFTNRLTAFVSIGFPLVLLALAAVVFFVTVGIMLPLAKLITDLAARQ